MVFSKKSVVVFLLLLFFSNAYNYVYWDSQLARQLCYFIGLIILFLCFDPRILRWKFNILILALFIEPMLSLISVINYEKSIGNENILNMTIGSLYLLPFVFKRFHFKEHDLISGLVIFALLGLFIQIFQLLNPSLASFGLYKESIGHEFYVESRNGINRYRLDIYMESLFCLFYYWDKFMRLITMKYFVLILAFMFSIYVYLSRQIILISILGILFSFIFYYRHNIKINHLIFLSIFAVIGIICSSYLFDELLLKTSDELNEDNIRVTCFYFYGEKILRSPLTFLIGSGMPNELEYWKSMLKLTPSDIGIVGEMFYFGALWILLYFYTLYVCVVKQRKQTPMYVTVFLVSTFIASYQIFPYVYNHRDMHVLWAIVLYLAFYSHTTITYQKRKITTLSEGVIIKHKE